MGVVTGQVDPGRGHRTGRLWAWSQDRLTMGVATGQVDYGRGHRTGRLWAWSQDRSTMGVVTGQVRSDQFNLGEMVS